MPYQTVTGIATCCLVLGLFYFMNARKRSKKIVSEKFYRAPAPNSVLRNLFSLAGPDAEEDWDHPEGASLSTNENSSWLIKESKPLPKVDLLHRGHTKGGKLVVVMVGLPGRGKTYIARKIARYLRWISYRTRAFSLAKYRLDRCGTKSADFFDPASTVYYQQRVNTMIEALEDALRYLDRGGEIAILDGTNTTSDRRQLIRERVAKENGYDILWIESIASSEAVTPAQLEELKHSPDFLDKADYARRLELYKQTYTSLDESEGSYVKVFDEGKKITLSGIHGFLPTKIVSFVMNLRPSPRPIYIVRHGESDFDVRGLIGGDSGLTQKGLMFAKALGDFMVNDELGVDVAAELCVWNSPLRASKSTAAEVKCKRHVEWRALREIDVGICDGLTYDQVKVRFPEEYRSRMQDKLKYRYPRGESYVDVITRLEPVIFELERQEEPLLIIAHQAVLRCLYAYFLDLPADEIPFLSIPLHTLVRLESKAYGCKEKRMKIVTKDDMDNPTNELNPPMQD